MHAPRLTTAVLFVLAALPSIAVAATPTPVIVNDTTTGVHKSPTVAMADNGDFVVAWDNVGEDGSLDGIFARRFAADGSALGPSFLVNTTTRNRQVDPAIAMAPDGRFVIAWAAAAHDRQPGISIWARRYAADGTPLGDEFQLNDSGRAAQPQVDLAAAPDGGFIAVWPESVSLFLGGLLSSDIVARRYAADGSPLGASFVVASSAVDKLRLPRVAEDAQGDFAVTWNADGLAGLVSGNLASGLGIYLKSYGPDGTAAGLTRRVASARDDVVLDRSDLALEAQGDITVVWQTQTADLDPTGLALRRYSHHAIPLTAATGLPPAAGSFGPRLAALGTHGLALAGFGDAVHSLRLDADGVPQADATPDADADAIDSAIAGSAQGGYVVVWQQPGTDGSNILARIVPAP